MGAKMAEGMTYARFQESVQSEGMGYQNEELMELQPIQSSKERSSSLQSIPTKSTEHHFTTSGTQRPTYAACEQPSAKEEETTETKHHPKDPRRTSKKLSHVVEAAFLGLSIYTSESHKYQKQ